MIWFALATLAATAAMASAHNVASHIAWRQIAPDTGPRPETRYSHCAIVSKSKMIITHGYFFDVSRNEAAWLQNTWIFDADAHTWSRVDLPPAHPLPAARYGATCVENDGTLIMHGGDDGGHSHGLRSYVHSFFNDVWAFSLDKHAWLQLATDDACGSQRADAGADTSVDVDVGAVSRGSARRLACAPRVAHGASVAIGKSVFALFGLVHSSAEEERRTQRNIAATAAVWRFDIDTRTWWQVYAQSASAGGALPAERYAVAAATAGDKIFIFGGYSLTSSSNFDDLWILDAQTAQWALIEATAAGTGAPSARGYHSMVISEFSLFLFGGARCTPGCVCNNELWALPLRTVMSAAHDYFAWARNSTAVISTDRDGTAPPPAPVPPRASWHALERDSSIGASARDPDTVLKSLDWPVHRYRQTTLAVTLRSKGAPRSHLLVFGGESYRPSAYYRDVWSIDVTDLHDSTTAAERHVLAQSTREFVVSLPEVAPPSTSAARWMLVAFIVAFVFTLLRFVRARKRRDD